MQPAVLDKPRWWLWPTILSLDAPVVALLWQALVARSAAVALGSPERLVLGMSVWLAYSADRWIEGWRLSEGQIRTHRHRFHVRWRWEIFIVWTGALALDVLIALRRLARDEILAGLVLLAAVAAYLLSHQLLHRASRWRAPKEACTALLLAAGAAVFVVSKPEALIVPMLVPLALFALLCFSNCALISVWESDVDVSQGQTSLMLQFAGAAGFSRALPLLASLASVAAWFTLGLAAKPAAACALASSLFLRLVDAAEPRTGRAMARVLADVALTTPLVPLLLLGGVP